MGDSIQSAASVIGLVAVLTLLALILYHTGVSVYRDAGRRGLRAGWITAATLATWPLGWLVYSLLAWRWPDVAPHQTPRGLDMGAWFRACWVGLFWFIASSAVLGLALMALTAVTRTTDSYTLLARPILHLAWFGSGLLTTLSYEARVFERSWRMPARAFVIGAGIVALWALLADGMTWSFYGHFANHDTAAAMIGRHVGALLVWLGGAGLTLVLIAKYPGIGCGQPTAPSKLIRQR